MGSGLGHLLEPGILSPSSPAPTHPYPVHQLREGELPTATNGQCRSQHGYPGPWAPKGKFSPPTARSGPDTPRRAIGRASGAPALNNHEQLQVQLRKEMEPRRAMPHPSRRSFQPGPKAEDQHWGSLGEGRGSTSLGRPLGGSAPSCDVLSLRWPVEKHLPRLGRVCLLLIRNKMAKCFGLQGGPGQNRSRGQDTEEPLHSLQGERRHQRR